MHTHRSWFPAVLAFVAIATLVPPSPAAAAEPPPPAYRPPVDAPVVDPFRPPATPYGSGNRGLEYATTPGAAVLASAPGEVVFAGPVAGTLHVTLLHADGLRTSYSYLASVRVRLGQRVAAGEPVGTAAERLHFGVRSGDAYLDPAALLGSGPVRVHLIPFEDPPGDGTAGERRAILGLLGGGLRIGGQALAWLGNAASDGASLARHYAVELHAIPHLLRISTTIANRLSSDRPCTDAHDAIPHPPGGRRIAVLVGGLGSTSEHAAIDDLDTRALGYDAADVVRFSYAGGRTPDPTDALDLAAAPYSAADSQIDLHESGLRLAALIEASAAAAPGASVDVLAHSQGGLVARLALAELDRTGRLAAIEVDLLATLGTPHQGADLATAVAAANATPTGALALDVLGAVLPLDLDPDGVSVAQLAETSEVVAELSRTDVPAGVRAVSIAARSDLVVPAPRAELRGAENVIVSVDGPRAHDALPAAAEATRELALALAGLPPTCESPADLVLDVVTGELISWTEDHIGAAALT